MRDILKCPSCAGSLRLEKLNYHCQSCSSEYSIENGIPKLFLDDADFTREVKDFYETTPFPKYNDIDDIGSLIKRANQGVFAKRLNEQLEEGTRILEAGCGTGQLSIYLSLKNREVYATDMSIPSLEIAKEFASNQKIDNVNFFQMNIFNPIFENNSFDVLISNGVLHHTHDAHKAFLSLLPLVKKDGLIIIGLYHKYGRIWTDVRRKLFNVSDKFLFLDEVLSNPNLSEEKRLSWHNDQYKHNHETKHEIVEVMDWFEDNNCQVLNVLPNPTFEQQSSSLFFPRMFDRNSVKWKERLMTLTNTKEGGFFTMIGKKLV